MRIRSANRQYKKSMAEEARRVRETCANETGARRRKCERKVGEGWRDRCDKKALSSAENAVKELRRKTHNPRIRKWIGGFNLALTFEDFLQTLRNFVQENYPEYGRYLRYL